MHRQLALAYGIAGLSIAAAVIVMTASTVGLGRTAESEAPPGAILAVPTIDGGMAIVDAASVGDAPASAEGAVEYVYVDEPARAYEDDDGHDDDEEHEHEDEEGHERHDDDDDDDDD